MILRKYQDAKDNGVEMAMSEEDLTTIVQNSQGMVNFLKV
jgi:hypothetical protein